MPEKPKKHRSVSRLYCVCIATVRILAVIRAAERKRGTLMGAPFMVA